MSRTKNTSLMHFCPSDFEMSICGRKIPGGTVADPVSVPFQAFTDHMPRCAYSCSACMSIKYRIGTTIEYV